MQRHPQSSGRDDEQDAETLESTQPPMPVPELQSELITDQDQSQNQRDGSGNEMSIKGPLVTAEKVVLTTPQKLRFKIRRKVIAIVQQHSNGDSNDQRQGHQRHESPEGDATVSVGGWHLVTHR